MCIPVCFFVTTQMTLVLLQWLSKTQALTLEFVSFYKFLPENVKEWYSPSDDDYLQSILKEQQHLQQH